MHDYEVKTETASKAVKFWLDIHVGRVPIAHYLKSSQTCSRLSIVCSGLLSYILNHSCPFQANSYLFGVHFSLQMIVSSFDLKLILKDAKKTTQIMMAYM